MSVREAIARARLHGARISTEEGIEAYAREKAYKSKVAAFEEWRLKRVRGERLPRGKFFVGKKPGARSDGATR